MPLPLLLTRLAVRTGLAGRLPAARRLTHGHPAALRYYSAKVLAAPLAALTDPAAFPTAAGPDVVHLNDPTPRVDSPVSAGRLAADRAGRPPAWGTAELREAIAAAARRAGRPVDPAAEVLVTHGATGAWAAVLDAFADPGDAVVLFAPCSPLFAVGAKSRRARVRWVPTATADGRLTFDPAVLARAMRGAKLLAYADPSNPTGGTLSAYAADRLAALAARHDVLVYRDETFARLRYDGPAARPPADRRTLVAGSVSAADGLGSVRVGWLTGPAGLVQAAALTATLSAPFVPTVCQQVAARAVAADDDAFAPTVDDFRRKRAYAGDRLAALGLTPDRPAGGYFLWVPVGPTGLTGRAFAERLLADRRVLVGPGDVYGPGGGGHVRVSFAADDGRLREGFARLAGFVADLRGQPAPPPAADHPPAPEVTRVPAFSRV